MDRTRFEELAQAYGADLRRWPAAEQAAAAAYAAANAAAAEAALAEAGALDRALEAAREPEADSPALAQRILAAAPTPPAFDRRAIYALAACALAGVLIGYGGGLLAPTPEFDDSYFAWAFEPPYPMPEDDG